MKRLIAFTLLLAACSATDSAEQQFKKVSAIVDANQKAIEGETRMRDLYLGEGRGEARIHQVRIDSLMRANDSLLRIMTDLSSQLGK